MNLSSLSASDTNWKKLISFNTPVENTIIQSNYFNKTNDISTLLWSNSSPITRSQGLHLTTFDKNNQVLSNTQKSILGENIIHKFFNNNSLYSYSKKDLTTILYKDGKVLSQFPQYDYQDADINSNEDLSIGYYVFENKSKSWDYYSTSVKDIEGRNNMQIKKIFLEKGDSYQQYIIKIAPYTKLLTIELADKSKNKSLGKTDTLISLDIKANNYLMDKIVEKNVISEPYKQYAVNKLNIPHFIVDKNFIYIYVTISLVETTPTGSGIYKTLGSVYKFDTTNNNFETLRENVKLIDDDSLYNDSVIRDGIINTNGDIFINNNNFFKITKDKTENITPIIIEGTNTYDKKLYMSNNKIFFSLVSVNSTSQKIVQKSKIEIFEYTK